MRTWEEFWHPMRTWGEVENLWRTWGEPWLEPEVFMRRTWGEHEENLGIADENLRRTLTPDENLRRSGEPVKNLRGEPEENLLREPDGFPKENMTEHSMRITQRRTWGEHEKNLGTRGEPKKNLRRTRGKSEEYLWGEYLRRTWEEPKENLRRTLGEP